MSNTRARAPLVWILRGPKAGDYAQLQLLARAIDVPVVTKQLVFRPMGIVAARVSADRRSRRSTARSRTRSKPPWPDLVLTAGRRNELVARWMRDGIGRPIAAGSCRTSVVEPAPVRSRRVESPVYARRSATTCIVNDLPLTDSTAAVARARTSRCGARSGRRCRGRGPWCWSAATAVRSCSRRSGRASWLDQVNARVSEIRRQRAGDDERAYAAAQRGRVAATLNAPAVRVPMAVERTESVSRTCWRAATNSS